MKIDFDLVWNSILEIIKRNITFVEGNNRIIDICKNSYIHEDWNDIQNIDYSKIPSDFIQCVLPDLDYIQNNINGLYFGITTVQLDNGKLSFAIEIGGTSKYDPNDTEYDWVYELNWYSNNYLFSNALSEVYEIANRENGLGNNAEWPLGLSISIVGINEMIRKIEGTVKNKVIGVVAGFHDGDMLKIKGINESS